MLRAAVVDEAEVGFRESRVAGHLHGETRLRVFAGHPAARHQPCDLEFARRPDCDGAQELAIPSDFEEQRDFDERQAVVLSIPFQILPEPFFHGGMNDRVQRRERSRTVGSSEKPLGEDSPVDRAARGNDVVAPERPKPAGELRRGVFIEFMADRIRVVNMGKACFEQESCRRAFPDAIPPVRARGFKTSVSVRCWWLELLQASFLPLR